MGGDAGPHPFIQAAVAAVAAFPLLSIILVGNSASIRASLRRLNQDRHPRLSILHAPEAVQMSDKPAQVFRHKRASSMWLALESVALGRADACVSAGNTGALMAMGRFLLKTLPGIDRPAICTDIPTESDYTYLLDLGANASCSAEQLHQFAVMGSALVSALHGQVRPGVALLNIGTEEIKGNEPIRLAARLIGEDTQLNYRGFIEGDRLYSGTVPVVVCDGFSGNVALKSSEGLARLIKSRVDHAFAHSLWARFLGWLAAPLVRDLEREIDPTRYNGASLLGLQGIVVKSHGRARQRGFYQALLRAMQEVEQQVPERISRELEQLWS